MSQSFFIPVREFELDFPSLTIFEPLEQFLMSLSCFCPEKSDFEVSLLEVLVRKFLYLTQEFDLGVRCHLQLVLSNGCRSTFSVVTQHFCCVHLAQSLLFSQLRRDPLLTQPQMRKLSF
jgi:hypothetical protein